jgi:hypothetical protein
MPVSSPFSALALSTSESSGVTLLVEIDHLRLARVSSFYSDLLHSLDHAIAHTWCCTVWHGSSRLPRKEYRARGPKQGNTAAGAAF